ncbi:hypothetical protein B0A49_03573 [Cryomyces minteri]|uniref:SPX domain-containing protein n=1 Tax=Cryomyces minteri TaxID=331657 RepID=A0A4U0XPV7_9PEZI|nr:hypothetical protein B0A49_03573 [Cryomyces minteri]
MNHTDSFKVAAWRYKGRLAGPETSKARSVSDAEDPVHDALTALNGEVLQPRLEALVKFEAMIPTETVDTTVQDSGASITSSRLSAYAESVVIEQAILAGDRSSGPTNAPTHITYTPSVLQTTTAGPEVSVVGSVRQSATTGAESSAVDIPLVSGNTLPYLSYSKPVEGPWAAADTPVVELDRSQTPARPLSHHSIFTAEVESKSMRDSWRDESQTARRVEKNEAQTVTSELQTWITRSSLHQTPVRTSPGISVIGAAESQPMSQKNPLASDVVENESLVPEIFTPQQAGTTGSSEDDIWLHLAREDEQFATDALESDDIISVVSGAYPQDPDSEAFPHYDEVLAQEWERSTPCFENQGICQFSSPLALPAQVFGVAVQDFAQLEPHYRHPTIASKARCIPLVSSGTASKASGASSSGRYTVLMPSSAETKPVPAMETRRRRRRAVGEQMIVDIETLQTRSASVSTLPPNASAYLNRPLPPIPSQRSKSDRYPPTADSYAVELERLTAAGRRYHHVDSHESRRERRRCEKLERLLEEAEMKFSHSIQFNAVPDWSSHYISYSNLKKLIFQLEKQVHQKAGPPANDAESSPLLNGSAEDLDKVFIRALDHDLEKICSFYQLRELEIYGEIDSLLKDEEAYEAEQDAAETGQSDGPLDNRRMSRAFKARQDSIFKSFGFGNKRRTSTMSRSREAIDEEEGESDEDANERSALKKKKSRDGQRDWDPMGSVDDMRNSVDLQPRRRTSQAYEDYNDQAFSALYDSGITLKKRAVSLYVSTCELRSFIQLNRTGFTKVLKKYDKILDRNLKSKYIEEKVSPAYPFLQSTMDHLTENLTRIEQAYADVVTKGDIPEAKRELRLHLREHVVWERNTVWREMIGIERKAQAANMGIRQTMLGADHDPTKARLQGDDPDAMTKELVTPVGNYRCPAWLLSTTFWTLIAIVVVFLVLLLVPIMKKPEQQNCLAMVAFVSLLWATEAIPLFVTSLLVPFLVVVLRVVRSDQKPHQRLESKAAASYVFASMWTPVIMLLLGGFTIAAALSKYNIAKMMATFVLSKAGTKPRTVLITSMFVAMFASMWISNVAAPVLCFSIIQPILRNLPSDSEMSKALLLGIALSSNMGGAASPIASPQNLIALQNMSPQPGWGVWFFVALPVCIISILLIWVLLLVTFKPGRNTTIVPIRPMKDKFTGIQWFISIVTIATIALWCASHQFESVFGDMGVIAIIPIIMFFGTGILTKEDFNNFLWTIIILAAGGLALGKAVNSSGLLHTIAGSITEWVDGMSLYGVLVVFAALILVVATFISHTVAALIVLPLVQQVGQGMSEPHPNLLVMGSVLMCSAAMGLPTSGFPNMTAVMMEDSQTGQRYLQVKHFITRGVPSSLIAYVVVITLGYGLMLAVGF